MSSSTASQSTAKDRHRTALKAYDSHVELQLKRSRSQVRMLDLVTSLMQVAIRVLVIVMAVALVDHWIIALPSWGRLATLLLLGTVVAHGFFLRIMPLLIWRINPLYAAQQIEQSMPSLKNGLINYVLLRGTPQHVHLAVLGALGRTTATQLNQEPDQQFADHRQLLKTGYLLILVFGCFAAYVIVSPKSPLQTFHRVLAPWGDIARPSRVEILEVKPGTTDVYFSESVKMTAQIKGATERDEVVVIYSSVDGQLLNRQVTLKRSESSSSNRISYHEVTFPPGEEGIEQDLVYQLKVGDAVSEQYRLSVIPVPTIVVQRVEYEYPPYTGLPPRVTSDRADISAVEGTQVAIYGRANQAIRSASLDLYSSENVRPLSRGMDIDGLNTRGTLLLEFNSDRRTQRFQGYELRFTNKHKERGASPIRHRIEMLRDLPPEIELLTPKAPEVEVPLNGSLQVEVRAIDPDFGLSQVLVKDDRNLFKTPLLNDENGMDGQFLHQFVIEPAQLGLQAGDSLTFYLVAKDNRRIDYYVDEENRRTGDGKAAPNTSQPTHSVKILVTEAENPDGAPHQPNEIPDKPQPQDTENPNPADDGEKGTDSETGGDDGEKGTDSETGGDEGEKGTDSETRGDDGEKGTDSETGGGESEKGAGGEQSGSGQGEEGDPHDGDVFQKILDRIKKERQQASDSDGSDDGSAGNEPEDSDNSNSSTENSDGSDSGAGDDSRDPADNNQPDSDTGDGSGTGEKADGPKKPVGPADPGSTPTDRQQKPGAGDDSTGRPANGEKPSNPGDKPSPEPGDKGADAGEKPGDKPTSNDPSTKKPTDDTSDGDGQKPADDKPTDNSPASDNPDATPSDGTEEPTDEPGKGDKTDDSRTAGSQGDKPAESQPSDSDGQKPESDSQLPSPAGSENPGKAAGQDRSASAGNNAPGKASGNPAGIGESGRKANFRGDGPDESEQVPNEVVGLPEEIPESDEARLDYARKVTNMVLEYLEDQQFNPDPDLLDETGLTAEQLREMVKRYEELARKAEQSAEGRQELEETLKSLGLRPRAGRQASQVRSGTRQIEGVSNAGTRSEPPPRFIDQFNAFKKGTARSKE
jgi:collagen type III alpha